MLDIAFNEVLGLVEERRNIHLKALPFSDREFWMFCLFVAHNCHRLRHWLPSVDCKPWKQVKGRGRVCCCN